MAGGMKKQWTHKRIDTPRTEHRKLVCIVMHANQNLQMTKNEIQY